ncbi:tetratricopeptide repeat protein [Sphingopyxis sp.]|uniref:tetratricopeptide repeat protein n=1 Tax=Sphingopyxis sp. TaxID=1908224 RepID=UPI003BAC4E21
MIGDDDIRALLPDPPPPAPKRREAAIGEAMARFDGKALPARAPRPATTPWWKQMQRPQAGLFAAAALVVAVGLPLAWRTGPVPLPPPTKGQVADSAAEKAPRPLDEAPQAPAIGAATTTAPAQIAVAGSDRAPAAPATAAPEAKRLDAGYASPPAPPPPPPPPAMRAEQSAPIVVQGQMRKEALQDTPVAVSVVSSENVRDSGSDVVVTGTRLSKSKPLGRGDWNACTVADPSRTLSRCKTLADKAAKAVRDQADAHLSAGLKQAWDGDMDGAIDAFDAAIAAAPGLSAAYLNRGLAYDRQGDSERAIADLDAAVRYAPKSARAYYNRSVLLRKYGDPKRAAADEQQAINLDARYQAILR